jgi:hypothetical protein
VARATHQLHLDELHPNRCPEQQAACIRRADSPHASAVSHVRQRLPRVLLIVDHVGSKTTCVRALTNYGMLARAPSSRSTKET